MKSAIHSYRPFRVLAILTATLPAGERSPRCGPSLIAEGFPAKGNSWVSSGFQQDLRAQKRTAECLTFGISVVQAYARKNLQQWMELSFAQDLYDTITRTIVDLVTSRVHFDRVVADSDDHWLFDDLGSSIAPNQRASYHIETLASR